MVPADEQNGIKIQKFRIRGYTNPHRCMLIDDGKNWRSKRTTRGPASDDLENLGKRGNHCPKLVRCYIKCYLGDSFTVRPHRLHRHGHANRGPFQAVLLCCHAQVKHSGDPFDLQYCDHPRVFRIIHFICRSYENLKVLSKVCRDL